MSEKNNIVEPWEAEAYVENLAAFDLEDLGTKTWFEFHKKLILLNQQSILEISTLREESIKEWFISFQRIPILIYEAIQTAVWKEKVFPLLIELNGEPSNTFMLYSVFYHESMAVSLLENVLFHSDSAVTLDDSVFDLVDYAVSNVITLIFSEAKEAGEQADDGSSCLGELLRKKTEMEFDIAMKCISILRYLAEFCEKLPLGVLSRMLSVHDVPYLLVQLIEKHPWKKTDDKDNPMIYTNGKWQKIRSKDENKLCKAEGQVWIGIRELLLNPTSGAYYEMTEFRISQLMKLQKYLQEHVLDQIAPLIELRRWLSHLTISRPTASAKSNLIVEVIPKIRTSILEKYRKKWKKLAKHQSKCLYTKNTDEIINLAKVLSGAYDMDKLEITEDKLCAFCQEDASKRCSKCKGVWYCGRECQVKDWTNHKAVCSKIIESKEAFGIQD
ncbi:zinc finger MYND domain-containing protein 10 [Venturia canescens]|uniref:zinc finger MYND domain-containing protein 10 n=1 Tax=Venturia canescens TaxID=32260 RepID=UPI001C9BD06C|nr:zinc finger MYND domain-containing protein 10 [Venturia canescens]